MELCRQRPRATGARVGDHDRVCAARQQDHAGTACIPQLKRSTRKTAIPVTDVAAGGLVSRTRKFKRNGLHTLRAGRVGNVDRRNKARLVGARERRGIEGTHVDRVTAVDGDGAGTRRDGARDVECGLSLCKRSDAQQARRDSEFQSECTHDNVLLLVKSVVSEVDGDGNVDVPAVTAPVVL
jgi:hypothetical protein